MLQSMFGSPKTTIGGGLFAAGAFLSHQPGGWALVGQVLEAVAVFFLGASAADAGKA